MSEVEKESASWYIEIFSKEKCLYSGKFFNKVGNVQILRNLTYHNKRDIYLDLFV